MEKIACPRCSKGIIVTPENIVWATLSHFITDWKEGKPKALLLWYTCQAGHRFYTNIKISEE